MEDNSWIKLNVYLRIIMIALMLLIIISIIYFRFGYTDPDDSQLKYDLGNITKTITCRDALYYYADKELHIYEKKNISYNPNLYMINLSK